MSLRLLEDLAWLFAVEAGDADARDEREEAERLYGIANDIEARWLDMFEGA